MSAATNGPEPGWPARAQVWIVLDTAASAPRSVVETAQQAIKGGVDAVVCRLKELPEPALRSVATQVRLECLASRTPFVMSHFPGIARELAADAVQLGQADPPLVEVRAQVGPEMLIGYSAHSIAEANAQLASGVDYCFLGPIYPTPAKLPYGAPLGLAVAGRAVEEVHGTFVCIGGITLDNIGELVGAGVQRVAAIAALQHDCDPAEAVQAFRRALAAEG